MVAEATPLLVQLLGTGGVGGIGLGAWKVGRAIYDWKKRVDQALKDCTDLHEDCQKQGAVMLRGLGVLTIEVRRLDPLENLPLRRVQQSLRGLKLPDIDQVLAGLSEEIDERSGG